MPPAQDVFPAAQLSGSVAMSTRPPTPPSDHSSDGQRMSTDHVDQARNGSSLTMEDNTAAGMAMSQEESMYITPAASPTIGTSEEKEGSSDQQEQTTMEEESVKQACQTMEMDTHAVQEDPAVQPEAPGLRDGREVNQRQSEHHDRKTEQIQTEEPLAHAVHHSYGSTNFSQPQSEQKDLITPVIRACDSDMNTTSQVRGWDFTDKPSSAKSPSSLFQPYSRFVGTQQSDRQTYNVEVTILTLDMNQSSLSGYLTIRGLTPDYPMLQTFFTGEIVGGPNQRYSFKTTNPAWGANDKVDLTHWLRFPPFRRLTAEAKRDLSFEYPTDGEPWYTQENVFMRWKEHFLVPDYKQSNIQGASFEGFYYICLNQKDGKISGVYFHSKSEKFQQLELTHITKKEPAVLYTAPVTELR